METSATLICPMILTLGDRPAVDSVPSDAFSPDMSRLDDRRLMERIVRGDADSFAAFYRRYERPLFNFLLRVTHQRALAEDLPQETFTRVWRAARTWDPGRGPARAWLYKVALKRTPPLGAAAPVAGS